MGVMPAAQNPTPSERPVIAFFDVDNTLMHGTSVFHVGREAWARGIIGWRDILLFGWHQRRFIKVGENHEHMGTAKDRALGLIAGFLEFIPTIGPVLSAVPAVAMGFLDSPEKALYVVIAYIAIQQLEGHILIPLLMKGGMDLPPVMTILAQALMALLFGFLGLMVAVPVLAATLVPIKMLYVERVVGDDVKLMTDDDDDDEDG